MQRAAYVSRALDGSSVAWKRTGCTPNSPPDLGGALEQPQTAGPPPSTMAAAPLVRAPPWLNKKGCRRVIAEHRSLSSEISSGKLPGITEVRARVGSRQPRILRGLARCRPCNTRCLWYLCSGLRVSSAATGHSDSCPLQSARRLARLYRQPSLGAGALSCPLPRPACRLHSRMISTSMCGASRSPALMTIRQRGSSSTATCSSWGGSTAPSRLTWCWSSGGAQGRAGQSRGVPGCLVTARRLPHAGQSAEPTAACHAPLPQVPG